MPAQRLRVVLDSHRSGLGGPQGVDAEQVRQCAVVDGDGLGDLQEPDQLQPVQTLGAGLVALDLRQPGVHGRVGRDQSVDVREPEEATHPVHHRHHRGVHQAALAQAADVQLNVRPLHPHQRVKPVAFTPREPLPQLRRTEVMGSRGVAGQEGDGRQLGGRHGGRLERQQRRRSGDGSPHAATHTEASTTPAALAARHSDQTTVDPNPATAAGPPGGDETHRDPFSRVTVGCCHRRMLERVVVAAD